MDDLSEKNNQFCSTIPGFLPFTKIKTTFSASNAFHLPYFAGTAIRGILGRAMFDTVCINPHIKNCTNCPDTQSCSYAYVFKSHLVSVNRPVPFQDGNKPMDKIHTLPPIKTEAPHPFVLSRISPEQGSIKKESCIEIEYTLIGTAIQYLYTFMQTLLHFPDYPFANRGKIQMDKIEEIHYDQQDTYSLLLYQDGEWKNTSVQPYRLQAEQYILDPDLTYNTKITFLTPVRIQHQGKITSQLSYSILLKSLIRRVQMLDLFYGAGDYEPVAKHLLDILEKSTLLPKTRTALHPVQVNRYSHRQNKHIHQPGMLGWIAFKKVPAMFIPLLKLGEIIQVGKGTSFGLGRYRLDFGRDWINKTR